MSDAIQVRDAFTDDQVALIKRTVADGCTNDELALFLHTAKRMGLDPLAKQIHAVKRLDRQSGGEKMSIQTGIDGFRVVAQRTGELDGQDGPYWCGEDGTWRDVWISKDEQPTAAKVIVYRKGCSRGFTGVATFASYAQFKRDGSPTHMWRDKGDVMLAKCAEALALRKAFPADLSGIYEPSELSQQQEQSAEVVNIHEARQKSEPAPKPLPSSESAWTFKSGEHQGEPIDTVPTMYLSRLIKHPLKADLKRRVEAELERRNSSEYLAGKLRDSIEAKKSVNDMGELPPDWGGKSLCPECEAFDPECAYCNGTGKPTGIPT